MRQICRLLAFAMLIALFCGFGDLNEIRTLEPNRGFFLHLKPDDVYTVCVPDYLQRALPGLNEEIEAAVNIWGYYIGHPVKLNFKSAAIAVPADAEDHERIIERHYAECGKDTDLVVAYAYFQPSDYIHTETDLIYHWRPEKKGVALKPFDLKRGLLIRKPSANDDFRWQTLQKITGKKMKAGEILELLKQRDFKVYTPDFKKKASTLRMMTHEMGHVWGLCDMYTTMDDSGTNCDPAFSELDSSQQIALRDDTIMSLSQALQPHYLSDNDIEGIRKLAKRAKVGPVPSDKALAAIPVNPIPKKPIDFVKLLDAEATPSGDLRLNFAVITNGPYHVAVELTSWSGDSETVHLENVLIAESKFDAKALIQKRDLKSYAKIRLVISEMPANAGFRDVPAQNAAALDDALAFKP